MAEKSAVAIHIKEHPTHQTQFGSARLVCSEPRYFHRKFMEWLHIQKSINPLNKDAHQSHMDSFYVTINTLPTVINMYVPF